MKVCRDPGMPTGMSRDVMWVMMMGMMMMIVPWLPEKREFRGSREGKRKLW